ncbi:MAG: aldolase catalytic domain-containing protein [Sphaerochaetaceae bacterium]|nr:aldolase catalytic domain-containing protein [Sphaerochaetaceae bacterium]
MEKHILDCTLRDGGYVNNWGFSHESASRIIDGLYTSGIRNIEIGIMGTNPSLPWSTKFRTFQEAEILLRNRKPDCRYALMINYAEKDNFTIPSRSDLTVDAIRIAFFANEWKDALLYAEYIQALGYEVFLQAMATTYYSETELVVLVKAINKLHPFAFYMVDSFGTMYTDDVVRMANLIQSVLEQNICFGFHAHNNIQMAFANSIAFSQTVNSFESFVDATIYGMGRGAGNVTTEMLTSYFNRKYGFSFDITELVGLFQREILPIYQQYYWGYSLQYFLTSSKNINSAYSWYFANKGYTDLEVQSQLLEALPMENRYALMKSVADSVIAAYEAEIAHKKGDKK